MEVVGTSMCSLLALACAASPRLMANGMLPPSQEEEDVVEYAASSGACMGSYCCRCREY